MGFDGGTQRLSIPGSGVGQHPQQLMLLSGPGMAMPTSQRTPSSPVQTISFKAEDVAITVDEKEPLISKKGDSVAIDMVNTYYFSWRKFQTNQPNKSEGFFRLLYVTNLATNPQGDVFWFC